MPRLAWFGPLPPARSGVAANSLDLVRALADHYEIEAFVNEPVARAARRQPLAGVAVRSAHDFLWRHKRDPYDLCVYQLGNSADHTFLWPYLFRYPGLTVLHDGHLHHARAAALLTARLADDYRAEFAAAHPEAPVDLAELAVAGYDSYLYYTWPMTRLVLQASRVTAVHTPMLARRLADDCPGTPIETIRLAHGRPVAEDERREARAAVRERHAIPGDAIVFGALGGVTPEKRIPEVLDAFRALLPYHPTARLLIVGAPARHYDLAGDLQARGLEAAAIVTGYVTDDALTSYVAACDVSLNLRWPSAREVSGPWLHALAAGIPTVTTDLWHLADVPSLDPRTWLPHGTFAGDTREAVTVAIDILDEAHSLRLALRRLASDAALRARLGRAGRAWWDAHHTMDGSVRDYQRVITRAIAMPDPSPDLPRHLRSAGDERLRTLLEPFGIASPPWSRI